MKKTFARKITKEYLKKLGIEYVSEDGTTVIKNGKQVNFTICNPKRPYRVVGLYDPEIRSGIPKEERKHSSGQFTLGVHILNYVWNKGDKPEGMVVDHINNDPSNNHIDNLQLLTPRENIVKEAPNRENWYKYELKCQLNKPRSFYEDKLEGYTMAYEQAKKDRDAEACHKLRSTISQVRARLRYYDNHIEEYLATKNAKQDCHTRAEKKKELKNKIDTTHKAYKKALEKYSKINPKTQKLREEWKLAIEEHRNFCAETKSEASLIS